MVNTLRDDISGNSKWKLLYTHMLFLLYYARNWVFRCGGLCAGGGCRAVVCREQQLTDCPGVMPPICSLVINICIYYNMGLHYQQITLTEWLNKLLCGIIKEKNTPNLTMEQLEKTLYADMATHSKECRQSVEARVNVALRSVSWLHFIEITSGKCPLPSLILNMQTWCLSTDSVTVAPGLPHKNTDKNILTEDILTAEYFAEFSST